jgi:hypothetical protein
MYASGTEDAPPGYAWVGEHGPELRKLRQGDKIVPHGQSMALANSAARDPASDAAATMGGGSSGRDGSGDVHLHNNTGTPQRATTSRNSDGSLRVDLYQDALRPGLRAASSNGDLGKAMKSAKNPLIRRA